MQIHAKAKAQMIAVLTEDLKHVAVENGKFLNRMTAFLSFFRANNVLPKQGVFSSNLEQWIGDMPFIEFGAEYLADELSLSQSFTTELATQSLVELEGYQDRHALATRLVEAFEEIPSAYTLTLELNQSLLPPLPDDATTYQIGGSRLLSSNLLLANEFPLISEIPEINERLKGPGVLAILLNNQDVSWTSEATFFQTQVDGFIGIYSGGSPLDLATSRLKSFLGLGLAMRLFSHESKYDPSPSRKQWVIHRREGEAWAIRNKISLDEEDGRTLNSLKLWDKFEKTYPEKHRVPWLQSVLKSISATLASEHSATLRLAAQWFWDSYKGSDEILRYVRRMTTLEIILGDGANTSEASLGEILGNRLAYLVGTTHQERAKILDDFRQIYNVRSKILHRGKRRLVGEERLLMARLQTLCEKALQAEAKIVSAPDKAPA